MEHRCVECGFPIETLFVQYSPGNIRLMRCANCEAVADEYIECEFMILVDVFVGNFMFICVFLLSMRLLLNTSIQISRCRDILLAVLVSSHFKIFLIATMVWEFPFSVIFIIDLFVLSSNTVALKVISESALNRCIVACFCAHAAKLLVTQISTQRSLRF
ncbi:hypothetical protein POPTR_002G181700v4 [Populus trichocarpa]|uniref:Uncharacterized protein n=1 Tax=Populus trichocarpa TaxID=3694 RepID=A0ACC0TF39_POPTR|nr:hypothetical protein POPTR_002G181700v4 [Populus trichocarpa]